MDRWSGRVALVTGASSGIGAAITRALVRNGLQVIGMARREDKLKEMCEQLKDAQGKLHPLKGDVTEEKDVLSAFSWAKDKLGGVDVLINNAGVMHESNLHDGKIDDWRRMLDVNVLGLSLCTREAVKNMRERGVNDGYIINISSLAGHIITDRPSMLMYCATKHAVKVLAEGIRKELVRMGSRIRVSSVSPGLVNTEFFDRNIELTQDKALQEMHMQPEDIADIVMYILSTPERVQIQDIIIRPTGTTY